MGRLSDVDRAWLRMEHPANLMMVTGVLTFDAPLDMDRLRETLEARLALFPRFRQRVEGRRWVDAEGFSIGDHLHHIPLPPPADRALLRRRIGALISTPLDPDGPLWRLTVLENPDGRTVLVARIHHCIADGFALMFVLLGLTDAGPDAEPRRTSSEEPPRRGSPLRRALQTLRRASGDALRARAVEVSGDLWRLLTLSSQPRTRLRGRLGPSKRAAWSAPVPLSEVKAIGRALGGTVNDVLMTAVAGAFRRYLIAHGEDPAELRCAVPVNLRRPSEMRRLGNHFGLVFVELPLQLATPGARFDALKRHMDRLKRSPEALVLWQVMRITGAAPRLFEDVVVRILGAKTSMVLTNVPGPREPRYLAGERIQTIMFWVPQAGRIGLGVSIFSYAGQVRLGLSVDARLVHDPERVLEAFESELEALAELGGAVIGSDPAGPTAPSPPPR